MYLFWTDWRKGCLTENKTFKHHDEFENEMLVETIWKFKAAAH